MSEEGKHSGKRVSDSGVKEPKSCQAILQSGKRKGLPCGAQPKPNSLFCGRSGHAPSKSKIVCSYISDETGDQCTYLTVGEGRYCDLHKNFCNVVIEEEEEEEEEEENTTSHLTSPHVHSDPPGSRDLAISSEDMGTGPEKNKKPQKNVVDSVEPGPQAEGAIIPKPSSPMDRYIAPAPALGAGAGADQPVVPFVKTSCKAITQKGTPCKFSSCDHRGYCTKHVKKLVEVYSRDPWSYEQQEMQKICKDSLNTKVLGGLFGGRRRSDVPYEKIKSFDEFALVAPFQLERYSKSLWNRLASALTNTPKATRAVDLTLYGAGVVFGYPDPDDVRQYELYPYSEVIASVGTDKALRLRLASGTSFAKDELFICFGVNADYIVQMIEKAKNCQPQGEGDDANRIAQGKLKELKLSIEAEQGMVSVALPPEGELTGPFPIMRATSLARSSSGVTDQYPWQVWLDPIVASGEKVREDSKRRAKSSADEDQVAFDAHEKYLRKIVKSLRIRGAVESDSSSWWTKQDVTTETEKDGTECYYWGKGRTVKTARKIGNKHHLSALQRQLQKIVSSPDHIDSVHDHQEKSGAKVSPVPTVEKSPEKEEQAPSPGSIPSLEPMHEPKSGPGAGPELESEPGKHNDGTFREWLPLLEAEAKKEGEKAGIVGTTIAARAENKYLVSNLGLDKCGIQGRSSDDKAGRGMHSLASDRFYDKDKQWYFWGLKANSRARPIGNEKDLEEFAVALDKLLPGHFGTSANAFDHVEGAERITWPAKTKQSCWDKLQTGTLYEAWKTAFKLEPGQVPAFVDDRRAESSSKCMFRVDMHGNVVSYSSKGDKGDDSKKQDHKSICSFEIDHLFPWSRGGLSCDPGNKDIAIDNVELVQWGSNRRKTDKFLHGIRYLKGWTGEAAGIERLDNGLRLEQFIALWMYADAEEKSKKKPTRLLDASFTGKKIIEFLNSKKPGKNSWKVLSTWLERPDFSHGDQLEIGSNLYNFISLNSNFHDKDLQFYLECRFGGVLAPRVVESAGTDEEEEDDEE